MVQVSKRFINQNVQQRIWMLFLTSLELCDRRSSGKFAEDLFTPSERIMLAKRFSIAYMLSEGYGYASIENTLKVSKATIGKVAQWLKEKGEGFRNIIKATKRHESTRKILEEIQDAILEVIGTGKGQDWSATKRMLRKSKLSRTPAF